LQWFGVPFRIIDRSIDRAHESRALAVQARTLEILDSVGLADSMVARGNRSTKLAIHFGARRIAAVTLGGFSATDTRCPFILFISQAETERILGDHLSRSGVAIERGVELVTFEPLDRHVYCVLRHSSGSEERMRAAGGLRAWRRGSRRTPRTRRDQLIRRRRRRRRVCPARIADHMARYRDEGG
jgi:2-polyprenyl-6-methoxyphenol hydroxylase-like FAD-dependent oxidoreductase